PWAEPWWGWPTWPTCASTTATSTTRPACIRLKSALYPGVRHGQGRPQDCQGQALQLQLRQRPFAYRRQGRRCGFGPGGEEGRDQDGDQDRRQEDRRQEGGCQVRGKKGTEVIERLRLITSVPFFHVFLLPAAKTAPAMSPPSQ